MPIELWSVYALAVGLLCLTPGPNSLLAITNGLRHGVRKTLFSTLGCASGLTVLIGLSLSGLGLILSASEATFMVIKWLGAGYLIYLGVSLFRSKASVIDEKNDSDEVQGRSNLSLFIQGFMIVATNPKVLIFFTAFLPQFYVLEVSFWSQFMVLAGTFVAIEIVLETLLASFANKVANYAKSVRSLQVFNRITGGTFVLAGVFLLTLERPK
jgi:homoserine/homoserine lactone efflux protein